MTRPTLYCYYKTVMLCHCSSDKAWHCSNYYRNMQTTG